MIQTNGPPKNATPIMNTKALFGEACDNSKATAMPTLETTTAGTGIPRLFKRPSALGA
jgi:hypothetical protein